MWDHMMVFTPWIWKFPLKYTFMDHVEHHNIPYHQLHNKPLL